MVMVLPMLLVCMVVTVVITVHVICALDEHKRKRFSGASLPLPPGPVALPIVGNAFSFIGPFGHNPHRILTSLAKTYGSIVSFRPGMAGNFVVVSSPEAAREALINNDAALAARFVPDNTRALGHCSESMFFLPTYSHLWKQHRITLGTSLSSARGLDTTRPIRDRHACRLSEHLRFCSGMPIKIGEAVQGTVLDVMSNILFTKDVTHLRVKGGQLFKDLLVEVLEDWTKPNVSDAFPFFASLDLLGSRRRISRGLAKLYKFFDEEFVERRLGSSENHHDLLDFILSQHAKSKLTRSEITKFFTDIFLAASNTSRIIVEWAMALLLKHPEKMKKLRAELAASLGTKEFVQESDLDKLPYIHAVVKEILRLQPSAPLLPRMVSTDGMSLGGFSVPIGTNILINLWAIGTDPTVWPQAGEFVPERFLGSPSLDFRGSEDFTYRPFGAGRRMCPGLDFAAQLIPLLLASMLHKIDWSLPDGIVPEDVDLRDRYSMVLELAKPLIAVPVSTV
ncbi:hypothetical protein SEVIR_8G246862v4 [Setaria viridis]|uniref:Cytochrome P450 n=1 Tax=Setaria viridis TaxID=4556 RepID=A0A4U6TPG6_SETVI|nr:cytochrome P450 76M5-like [Setaria viridis]TKW02499.1 hypothetical protein SEVIR_8G246862v2 [Setaria viridis]